ncbi:hypothetical protein [Paenibacillus chungangensis]|uniref:Uncharacterized protein n=1 Tax=Paenibacillus chungangensis TaxID=696535 RepID=A0ABW3HPC4_9BACL
MMGKIIAVMFVIPFILLSLLSIFFPEIAVRTTALNTLKKKPSKGAVNRYKKSGYVMLIGSIVLIVLIIMDKVRLG